MFRHSQAVLFNTSRNGDFRYIDILNIFACIMSSAIKPPFSYTFVSIPLYLHLVASRYSFSFLLFRRNKRKIQPRMWGRSPRKLRRLRWFLRKSKLNSILSICPAVCSRAVSPKPPEGTGIRLTLSMPPHEITSAQPQTLLGSAFVYPRWMKSFQNFIRRTKAFFLYF